ncbi:hypothetical protein [Lutibacter sp. HS1-25]|uniref:hypothetical protein n=1 Tax=Lutibacter sp. HS1-25 TaxID=2485000 RepID=UPI001011614E|nr:hypothetical protein [Lutibacter sp. HS1-25]
MKKIILLLLTTLILTSFNEYPTSEFSIVGKWKGEDEKDIGYITFQDDGYAYFEFQGQIIGGKEFVVNGKKGTMTYEVNYLKTPIEIDIIVQKIESGEINKLLCIVENIEKNVIKLQMDFNGNRPIEFDDKEAIIFQRVE